MKKTVFVTAILVVTLAINLMAQAGGGASTFITKDGEVWADDTYGLIFQLDGQVFDVRKMGDTWFSQRQNGTWTGDTWDERANWTMSVNGNTLTFSYFYTDDEGEEHINTETYIKITGQKIEIRH